MTFERALETARNPQLSGIEKINAAVRHRPQNRRPDSASIFVARSLQSLCLRSRCDNSAARDRSWGEECCGHRVEASARSRVGGRGVHFGRGREGVRRQVKASEWLKIEVVIARHKPKPLMPCS